MNNDNHFSRELSKYIFGFLNYKIYLKTKKLDLVVHSYNLSTGEAGPGELYSETFLKCCAYLLSLLSMWQDNQHHGNTPLHMSMRVPWERFNWVSWEDPPWMWAGTILVVWLPRPGSIRMELSTVFYLYLLPDCSCSVISRLLLPEQWLPGLWWIKLSNCQNKPFLP